MTTNPYTHHPRPAVVAQVRGAGDQRRFGGDGLPIFLAFGEQAEVLRMAGNDFARLNLFGQDLHWRSSIKATPAELRELAARLLDAAHDIQAHPAAELTNPGEGA